MRCEEFSARLPDELMGRLDDTDRAAMRQHVATCSACLHEIESLGDVWGLLAEIPTPAPDSGALRARLDAAVRREQQQQRPARREFRFNQWLLAAGVAGVALVAGLVLGRASQPPSASADVTALHEELRDLRHMVALSLMQQQSASERLKGVGWSSRLEGPSDEVVTALIDTLRHDANVNVRLASIDALKRFAGRDDVRHAAIDALQTQRSPLVQMALIDFVVETQEHGAAAALRRISGDAGSDQAVRTHAAWGLEHLGV
jgi:hypothetical protein